MAAACCLWACLKKPHNRLTSPPHSVICQPLQYILRHYPHLDILQPESLPAENGAPGQVPGSSTNRSGTPFPDITIHRRRVVPVISSPAAMSRMANIAPPQLLRDDEGRIRIAGVVHEVVEVPGWPHEQVFSDLDDAIFLSMAVRVRLLRKGVKQLSMGNKYRFTLKNDLPATRRFHVPCRAHMLTMPGFMPVLRICAALRNCSRFSHTSSTCSWVFRTVNAGIDITHPGPVNGIKERHGFIVRHIKDDINCMLPEQVVIFRFISGQNDLIVQEEVGRKNQGNTENTRADARTACGAGGY